MMSPSTSSLLERDTELAHLEEAAAEAASGRGRFVVLEGVGGIGKTRLLDALAGFAADAGMRVARARAGELERDFAFGVVRQLVDPMLARGAPEDRDRWLAGAAALARPLLELAARRPAGTPRTRATPVSTACTGSVRTSRPTGRSRCSSTTPSGPTNPR